MKVRALLFGVVCLCIGCSHSDKGDAHRWAPQFVEVYENGNWQRVIAIYDSLNAEGAINLTKDTIDGITVDNILVLYSDALIGTQQEEKAIEILNAELEREPSHLYLKLQLGKAYMAAGDEEQAVLKFQDVIKQKPTYARPYLFLASFFEQQDKNDEAVTNYLQAINLFYGHQFWDEVGTYSAKVLHLDSMNIESHWFLAKSYEATKAYEDEYVCLKQAASLMWDQIDRNDIKDEKDINDVYCVYYDAARLAYYFNELDYAYNALLVVLHYVPQMMMSNEKNEMLINASTLMAAVCKGLNKEEEYEHYSNIASEVSSEKASQMIGRIVSSRGAVLKE